MIRRSPDSFPDLVIQHGANALLAAAFSFLRSNDISKEFILKSVHQHYGRKKSKRGTIEYKRILQAYEDMGTIMSTWYSLPRFLDSASRPLSLAVRRGSRSIASLVRYSRVSITTAVATQLMRQSPSIRVDAEGNFWALKRVFVLPEFAVPRAALVIERYLDTLRKNASAHKKGSTLLLERNCHVPELDLKTIAPILRDIKSRGTAFMNSVDGDIEARRPRRTTRKGVGELGVLIFAWTRPSKARIAKSISGSRV